MAAFAETDDLITLLPGTSEDFAELALDMASAAIREHVGWNVHAETDQTHTYRGGLNQIILPTLYLTAVTSVVEAGETLTVTDDYEWTTSGVIYRLPALSRWASNPYETVVTYDHGYAESATPDIFRTVCLSVASRMTSNPSGLRSLTVGGISEVYTVPGTGQVIGGALNEYEMGMLSRYRIVSTA